MSNYVVHNGELYHWGIKGMKWGVRRYQNADGTLTDAGKKRYDRDFAENQARKKDNRINIDPDNPDVRRWVKEDNTRSKNLVDKVNSAVSDSGKFIDKIPTKKQTIDLSKMSNQEMRAKIDREKIEREYLSYFAPEKKSKGKEIVKAQIHTMLQQKQIDVFLKMAAKFPYMSYENILLLLYQMPAASLVCGKRAWKHLNTEIRNGERAIALFAPKLAENISTDAAEGMFLYREIVGVYDISQTEHKNKEERLHTER